MEFAGYSLISSSVVCAVAGAASSAMNAMPIAAGFSIGTTFHTRQGKRSGVGGAQRAVEIIVEIIDVFQTN